MASSGNSVPPVDPKSNVQSNPPAPEEKKDSYFGAVFEPNNGEVTAETISSKALIGLLFSAQWCPPCSSFLPILKDFYKEINFDEHQFEIFFASYDKSHEQFKEYFEKMPWKAFPFGDERCNRFKNLYGVTGIPKLIILTPEGLLVTKMGRNDVVDKGEQAWTEWLKLKEEAIERFKNAPPPPQPNSSPVKGQVMTSSYMLESRVMK